jgi:serine/threonine-protein kinase
MELLRGLDLSEMVASFGPLDARRAVHVIRQAASSLAEAHDRGLVHRDVKPANLFAVSTGESTDFVKVLDFGLVRELVRPRGEGTREGITLGTPAYMAPEQFLGADVGPAADVYGLAATLYYLLTGVPPFDDRGSGDAGLWRAHTRDPLVPVNRRREEPVPDALEQVIATAMAKSPADRYRDAAAFGKALDAVAMPPWTIHEAAAWWTAARLTPVSIRRLEAAASGGDAPARGEPRQPATPPPDPS